MIFLEYFFSKWSLILLVMKFMIENFKNEKWNNTRETLDSIASPPFLGHINLRSNSVIFQFRDHRSTTSTLLKRHQSNQPILGLTPYPCPTSLVTKGFTCDFPADSKKQSNNSCRVFLCRVIFSQISSVIYLVIF